MENFSSKNKYYITTSLDVEKFFSAYKSALIIKRRVPKQKILKNI